MVESTNDSRMEERNQSETGRHGSIEGAERAAVEALLEMAKFLLQRGRDGRQSSHFRSGTLRRLLRKYSSEVVWAWAMHCGFVPRILRVLCGVLRTPA